jgi:hypothetical protein
VTVERFGEKEAVVTSDVAVAEISHPWWGDNPYFLLIVRENTQLIKIDLDVTGWMTIYKDWLRGRMRWYLIKKSDDRVVFGIEVYEGDQPWYVKRHTIDIMGVRAGTEWIAHGIGVTRRKKRRGLWVTGDGLVCDDTDVDTLMRG